MCSNIDMIRLVLVRVSSLIPYIRTAHTMGCTHRHKPVMTMLLLQAGKQHQSSQMYHREFAFGQNQVSNKHWSILFVVVRASPWLCFACLVPLLRCDKMKSLTGKTWFSKSIKCKWDLGWAQFWNLSWMQPGVPIWVLHEFISGSAST